jgi:AspT/YidE/YbjL antiporter-like protein
MDWFTSLFLSGHGVANALVAISAVAIIGLAVGEIKIGVVKLGIAGPLFVGIAFGHFGLKMNMEILEFAREFGLCMFVYGVGIMVGPNFLQSFKKDGALLNAFAAFIVISGGIIAISIHFGFGIPLEVVAGLFSGGTTNTPSLAAGMQMLKELKATTEQIGIPGQAYAVAYPFGIIGILLTMGLVRMIFRVIVPVEAESWSKILQTKSDVIESPGVDAHNHHSAAKAMNMVVTRGSAFRKTIASLKSSGVTITRITRGNVEIVPDRSTKLQYADQVTCVGEDEALAAFSTVLGNDRKVLQHTQMIPIFIGIFLGAVLGSVPIFIPGLPVPLKLGMAGGPVIVAIALSHFGTIGPLIWRAPTASISAIREIGINLFMCCVGIYAGKSFFDTVLHGDGLKWMLCATLITFIPLCIAGVELRSVFKMNYLTVCGVLAGSMTDPPALAFANAIHPSEAQGTAYATVYPLTMCLRIVTPQIMLAALWAVT